MSFLAGEWVDAGLSWRVVLCACGGPLRPDMALAIRHGSAACSSNSAARWVRAGWIKSTTAFLHEDITVAAVARAYSFVRPGQRGDPRLRLGRGDEAWVDSLMQAHAATQRNDTAAPELHIEQQNTRICNIIL